MLTVGDFLQECGRRLSPYERLRVGRLGCLVSIAAMLLALAALALGWYDTEGSWAAGFRFVVACALATVVVLFVGVAAAETVVERSIRRRVEAYARESGNDFATLLRAAEMRRTHIPGGNRVVALLKDLLS